MGFGWFGLSTFWLLALCWPGVRGLLGGEIRIFGPGTLRVLLGVPLTMVSSATLAALTGGDSTTAGGSVGQTLSHGLHVALGGTLAMGVTGFILLFSLPLVFGTTWWGMFSRGTAPGKEDDAPSFGPRESRESHFHGGIHEPVRGLSQMSFDTAERSERGERGGYLPTLGQGHHNVGSLAEAPVPRRRGLAAQPRWKLTDEERARLDAMQPPPLSARGGRRAEPSFGSTGTRAVLPRHAYGAGAARGEALRMTEFVRAEPGLPPRAPRVPPTASPSATSSTSSPMASAATTRLATPRPMASASGVSPSALSSASGVAASSPDALHSTSIPGTTGYRRPVGTAPAHLRGTVVHSPFRKPQLGLEDVPPRGAPPMAARPQTSSSQTTLSRSDASMTPSAPTANPPFASPSASPSVSRPAAGSVMRGAASWSAGDVATPLSSDISEFSPVGWSVNDVETPSAEPVPEGPTPEMRAQQEAARAAEQARVEAMAALRNEAEALLRDLRQWSRADAGEGADVASAEPPAGETERPMPVGNDIGKEAGKEAGKESGTEADVAASGPEEVPSLDAASPIAPGASAAPLAASEVLNLPPTVLLPKAAVTPSGASMSTPPRAFVFADVLASVEAYDASPVEPDADVKADVKADAPATASAPAPMQALAAAVAEASFEAADEPPPFDASEASEASKALETSDTSVIDDDIEPSSKPHYVLRADGTWARADEILPTSGPIETPGLPTTPVSAAAPAAATVPAIPSFTAASASATAPTASFGEPPAPAPASFSPDTPYELPPPRVAVDYDLPALDLLSPAMSQDIANVVSDEALAAVSQLIEQRLAEFKVPVTVVGASAGPVITRFEVEPAVGVRGAQVVGLMKDLARALGVTSIRVVETIPGKTCMGLELPNAQRQMIRLSEILTAPVFDSHRSRLALAMGKDITGEPVVADLARAPHLLVAGTTGSGKSVAVNAMILSLLYKATPDDVRLIMIDPKMLELSVYGGIPHLLAPVVTDMKQAAHALNWCVGEMEKRYRLMSALGVRNLAGYNEKIDAARAAGDKVSNPFSLTPDAPEPLDRLPFIVVVIDELADLMMVAGKKIEELIARLAQKARAAGIHLILATQRPSVDVITGLIKANIPTRVAFQVSSKIDSRTILDQMGAESLLGQGDMLFLPPGTGYPQRVHGAFVADDEVHRVVEHWQQYGEPDYDESILAGDPADAAAADLFGDAAGDAEADPLYDEAAAFVLNSRRASISAVQRQLRIGYNRAARLIEQMEAAGLVTPMGRNGTREVVAPGE
ncbi:hypothetical protein AB870_22060 [Pandoraea faecigallinarum]|uniref:FtsK domain-containing protein n=1 Tax=Pandoraea faecigallinarum TaxID=656179 RepID=A0A0H3WZV7_9BURK|nr:DNA translocase FtsK [Pandoraea faecigallinarum]AKM32223.1 hypothetical protein AB870_22060 [Pandoraea faecigallinarum]